MLTRFLAPGFAALWLLGAVSGPLLHSRPLEQVKPTLQSSLIEADRAQQFRNMLAAAVRHELATLPYYDVFDWLEAELLSDGRVILRGEVVRPTTYDDAERRVRKIESSIGYLQRTDSQNDPVGSSQCTRNRGKYLFPLLTFWQSTS